ncbi:MAG TPA: PQQ-binding-like beta-propeller repeat protein [Longimicrobiaceae bacterium]|nr:PQQ-binding-like beta-propeller repeat protein [Longimicrobiaceae bacterium]
MRADDERDLNGILDPAGRAISRRDLLKLGVAAGLAPAFRWLPAAPSFTFAYFSDTHLGIGRNYDECRALVTEMAGAFRPELAVNGGDVTDYGWAGEYDAYDRVLVGLPFPVHHLPGNHDVRWAPLGLQIFRRRVGPPFRSFDHRGCHFVLLDSTVPLSHWGHFESAQLRWLAADLRRTGRSTPVFLFTHHWTGRPPLMVDNERALYDVIEPYNVRIVFTGHGHADLLWEWDGLTCTMNRGLYQGSYQRVDVDADAGVVRLSRRTTEDREPRLLATVPLRAPREKRPLWAVGVTVARAGEPVPVRGSGPTEARWNEGEWIPLPPGGAPTGDLPAGTSVLRLRAGEHGPASEHRVRVRRPESRLQPRWERRLSGGVMSHLLLADGTLYVSAMDGTVNALRAADGRPLWKATTGGYCHSSPVLHGGRIIVGSADGAVHAFRAREGRPLWKRPTGGPVYASAAVAQGVAAIASGDGAVYGLDPESGAVRWRYSLPPGNSAFAQSPAATDGERIFLGAWDTFVYALDAATGELVWRRAGTDRSFAYSPAIGGPVVGGGTVYIPANGNVLHAFDAATGETRWTYTSPGDKVGYSSPALVGDRVYIGCLGDRGEVRCISAADGKEVWTAATGSVIYDSSPAVADGHVSIGSVNGLLSVLSAGTGEIVAQYRLPVGHLLASPAAGGRSVYAASYSDVVMGFDLRV